jgi:hypothetical protein
MKWKDSPQYYPDPGPARKSAGPSLTCAVPMGYDESGLLAEAGRMADRMAPPRVLVVMPAQWQRALLRAALREVGYDAVGAHHLVESFRSPAVEAGRGPVRLIVVDDSALGDGGDRVLADLLTQLLERHPDAATLLIARSTHAAPAGPWHHVLRRPLSIGEIVRAVETLLPLPPAARHPVD